MWQFTPQIILKAWYFLICIKFYLKYNFLTFNNTITTWTAKAILNSTSTSKRTLISWMMTKKNCPSTKLPSLTPIPKARTLLIRVKKAVCSPQASSHNSNLCQARITSAILTLSPKHSTLNTTRTAYLHNINNQPSLNCLQKSSSQHSPKLTRARMIIQSPLATRKSN